jgi:hypothetical protein
MSYFIKAAVTVFLTLLAAVGLMAGFLFIRVDPLQWKTPSDERVIALFQHHQAQFEKLKQMTIEDYRHGYYFDASESEEAVRPLRPSRRKVYQKLLSQIDPNLGMSLDGSYGVIEIRFTLASGGMGPLGDDWIKGIEYLSGYYKEEGKILPSLDAGFNLPDDNNYLRTIQPNWYVFYSIY